MAVTATVTKLNDPHAGPYTIGSRRCAYISVTMTGTYETGGFAIPSLEDLFGLRWLSQVEVLRANYDVAVTALRNVQPKWVAADQKLQLWADGSTGSPAQVVAATNVGTVKLDLKVWSQ